MNISGVLVHARPEHSSAVRSCLEQLEGVEVHGVSEDGRLVVTVEKDREADLSECVLGMHHLPDILSVSMIYHQFEDDSNEGLPS